MSDPREPLPRARGAPRGGAANRSRSGRRARAASRTGPRGNRSSDPRALDARAAVARAPGRARDAAGGGHGGVCRRSRHQPEVTAANASRGGPDHESGDHRAGRDGGDDGDGGGSSRERRGYGPRGESAVNPSPGVSGPSIGRPASGSVGAAAEHDGLGAERTLLDLHVPRRPAETWRQRAVPSTSMSARTQRARSRRSASFSRSASCWPRDGETTRARAARYKEQFGEGLFGERIRADLAR